LFFDTEIPLNMVLGLMTYKGDIKSFRPFIDQYLKTPTLVSANILHREIFRLQQKNTKSDVYTNIYALHKDVNMQKWNVLTRRDHDISDDEWIQIKGTLEKHVEVYYSEDIKIRENIIAFFEKAMRTSDAKESEASKQLKNRDSYRRRKRKSIINSKNTHGELQHRWHRMRG